MTEPSTKIGRQYRVPFSVQSPSSPMPLVLKPVRASLLLLSNGCSPTPPSRPMSWLISEVGPSYMAKSLDFARWAMASLSRIVAWGIWT